MSASLTHNEEGWVSWQEQMLTRRRSERPPS